MFDPIPKPDIDLNLDRHIQVKTLLDHPLVENVWPAGHPEINDKDLVHLYLKGGAIQIDEMLYASAKSISPIPRYQPNVLVGGNGISYFSGMTNHPWESHQIVCQFHDKYIEAGVSVSLVEFIHRRILSRLSSPLDEDKKEQLWLLIASAALQWKNPNQTWFMPWLTHAGVKMAARRIFGADDWIAIVIRGHDRWVVEKNLGERWDHPAEAVPANSPFALQTK